MPLYCVTVRNICNERICLHCSFFTILISYLSHEEISVIQYSNSYLFFILKNDCSLPFSIYQVAVEIIGLVGYQRLSMQIIGALKSPINKKKPPMSWLDIKGLILELRSELGLMLPV